MEDKSANKKNEGSTNSEFTSVTAGKNLNQSTPDSVSTKPVKPEEKPFSEFILDHLIPDLTNSLTRKGFPPKSLTLKSGERPVIGGNCWMLVCEISSNRLFWVCFSSDNIKSSKTICLSETPIASTIESFLIDEKRITGPLIISRILQRLNGQKWLGSN